MNTNIKNSLLIFFAFHIYISFVLGFYFNENSIIIEAFTLEHGKYSGIVYGGLSRKQKGKFQIGNKFLLNWKSKNENKSGYFNIELIKPVSPFFLMIKKDLYVYCLQLQF